MRERQFLDTAIGAVNRLNQSLQDNIELIAMGEEEKDAEIVKEAEAAIREIKSEADKRQIETLLSGEADSNDTYVEVHSGAGGTESQDWAAMLQRMYMRWAERRRPTPGQEMRTQPVTRGAGSSFARRLVEKCVELEPHTTSADMITA